MAKNDDAWRRYREREDESDSPKTGPEKAGTAAPITTSGDSAGIDQILRLIEPLIEQTNNLYAQYVAGVERRPPIEKRKQLDSMAAQLLAHPKPTSASKFKAQTVLTRYQIHRDRWDKLLRDLEDGKIKRLGAK